MQSQPIINENSKKIVRELSRNKDKEDIHNRLYKAKQNKNKTHKVNKEIDQEVQLKINPLLKLQKDLNEKPVHKVNINTINTI